MNRIRNAMGAALGAVPTFALLASLAAACLVAAPAPGSAATQVPAASSRLAVDVWINKEEGGVFTSGEKMQVFFRASQDAYVLIYNIDTEGYIHLIYPFRPNDPMRVRGGDTYRVPSRHDPYDLVAEGPEGMEYVVAVASPLPFENLPWYLAPGASSDARDSGDDGDDQDDLDQGVIVGDPYVGMGRVMSRVVPNGREDRVATANTYFYIERRVEYPRYVCADCHHRTYWFDPYVDYCSVVEIRVDATWYRYAPVRYASARPRYYYRVKPSAPTRYRQWKDQWSSLDGNRTLRERFVLEREAQGKRPRDESMRRQTPPEFRGLRRYRPDRFWHGRDQVIPLREREEAKENQRRDGRGRRDESTGPPSTDRRPDRRRDAEERRREEPRDRTPDQRNEPRRREERGQAEERHPDERRRGEPQQEERRQQPDERRQQQDERRQPDNRQQQNDDRGRADERGGTRERGR